MTRQVDCGQPPNQRTDSASRNQADNISRWNYADCGSTILACQQPATNGGAPIPVSAFVTQTRDAATGRWTSSAAWCPATTTAIPGTALLHEQALRLLPHVMIGTTGNAISLVNIQTILWARTTAARDLGQVTILGQPVWLRLALDHANWGFGDDTSDVTTSPGKAFDPARSDCATVLCPGYFGHVYTGAGTKTVSLTIAWIASFSLDGRSYQPIGTSAMVGPEATVSLTLRQSRGVLVTGPEAR